MQESNPFFETLKAIGETLRDPVPVTLSPELIGLLSDQLYRSPSKAIEELVINGYDADANEARVFVENPGTRGNFVVVYDNGSGMTYEGIADLWKVGRPKPRTEQLTRHAERKQIGKFGIGKLSTYAIANRVSYISKTDGHHLGVTINYGDFKPKADRTTTAVELQVREISAFQQLWSDATFRSAVDRLGLSSGEVESQPSWTIVILEDLKQKAHTMELGRLRWVLRTAMPMSPQFRLFLNGEEVRSSKEDFEVVVKFDVKDMPTERIDALGTKTKEEWTASDVGLSSGSFPSGISGNVRITRKTLLGKSADVFRSEGFFVYVRGRLVNEEDARFGLHELSHATLNRFRAIIIADDLDEVITANRESMENVKLYRDAQSVLNEIFNEARSRYNEYVRDKESKPLSARQEEERSWVPERLVEWPTADAITAYSEDFKGAEPDESWMYLKVDPQTDISELASSLYSAIGSGRGHPYTYEYSALTSAGRLVYFDPYHSTFTINQDHELTRAYASDPSAQRLLHDLVTGEALLEVYLREAGLPPSVIGEVLEQRDLLFRGLADAQMFSLEGLSTYIRESAASSTELEIALVAGTRALGFVTKHLGASGEPDGIARFMDFPDGEQKIILEAKSSVGTPTTKDIDFASISTHMSRHSANGCLLIAPSYQGDENSNAVVSARELRISCWTVYQFSKVVGSAEARQISARDILKIVLTEFSPHDVRRAVTELLKAPTWESRALYAAVIRALRKLHEVLPKSPRSVTMIATEIARMADFENVEEADVHRAVSDLAGASQGALLLRGENHVILNVDYDELDRRVETLTGDPGTPRRRGMFAEKKNEDE